MSDLEWHPLKAIVHREGAYIERLEGKYVRSEHVHEAVLLDFDKDDNLIGVEVLGSPKEKDAPTESGRSRRLPADGAPR